MMKRWTPIVGLFLLLSIPSLAFGQSTKFYRSLLNKHYASFDDALKAGQILHQGTFDVDQSFEERLNSMNEADLVDNDWDPDAADPVSRGQLAYMIMKILDLEGGLITRVFGISERYAYRELKFIGIMAGENSRHFVRGEELLSIMRATSRYRKERKEEENNEENENDQNENEEE